MRESRTPGSARGAAGNSRPYRDPGTDAYFWPHARTRSLSINNVLGVLQVIDESFPMVG